VQSRPIVHSGGSQEKLTIAIAMAVELKERMVQARVLTNCPLCGFRQRLDRLTGAEYQVTDLGDLLLLDVAAVFAGKGRGTLHTELLPLKLKPGQRQAMLEALAAKMLPLVRLLSVEVPEFREALEAEEVTVTLRAMPLEDSLPLEKLPMPLKLPMSRDVPESRLPMPLKLPMSRDVPEPRLEVDEWQTEKSPMSLTTETALELPMTGVVPKVVKHDRRGST